MKFSIYDNDTLIAWSRLEAGDPLMGMALGAFFSNQND